MDMQKQGKLSSLLAELDDSRLVSSRWLRERGYSSSLIARYVRSGWLVSPARGVYMRAGGGLTWEGVVHSLQRGEGARLHVGGRFALSLHGYEHYLRLGGGGAITLYGPIAPPGWLRRLPMKERWEYAGRGPFGPPPASLLEGGSERIAGQGLVWHPSDADPAAFVCSMPERAMLELCAAVREAPEVREADALMQSMRTLRPGRVASLLGLCQSIKAKRLFLALADRHRHPWLSRVSLEGVDLGAGKRALIPGGRMHPVYWITLPEDLDDHLG